jgi:hypothetical protein
MSDETKRKITREVRWNFTRQEIRQLGVQMAREAQAVYDARAQKVATVAEFMAQIKSREKCVADLATKINNGYEMREVPCDVVYDHPQAGWKTIVRADNGERVEDGPMTDAEMQREFIFPIAGDEAEKPQ